MDGAFASSQRRPGDSSGRLGTGKLPSELRSGRHASSVPRTDLRKSTSTSWRAPSSSGARTKPVGAQRAASTNRRPWSRRSSRRACPQGLFLTDGTYALADQYVFACGPWLPELFPRTIGSRIRPNRQDVFFFGAPAGDPRFTEEKMPCFLDGAHSPSFYGIPGNEYRGFKVAGGMEDAPTFDPTNGERRASPEQEGAVRRYLDFRFPRMKGAPLVESRVCQYESTPDSDLIFDRHPRAGHVILGGGSGHGFKHGPALGERAAAAILGERGPDLEFSLTRTKIASFP